MNILRKLVILHVKNEKMEIAINDISELGAAASLFINTFPGNRVFAFRAPMGAGKTTFISEVCRRLGSADEASSPTFSIVNEYDTEKWGRVYHLDCYRIDSAEEAFDIGVEDYFDSGCACFVEWPERIEEFLPDDTVEIGIRVEPDGKRIMTIGEK